MIASSAGHESIVIMLLEKNADIHIVNFTGQSCLHYAASKNQSTVSFVFFKYLCLIVYISILYAHILVSYFVGIQIL